MPIRRDALSWNVHISNGQAWRRHIVQTRRIGSLDVSVVGIGCNNFGRRLDAAGTAAVVHAAFDNGVNLLDTADMYSLGQSEEYIGKALGSRRSEAIIATKFGMKMDEEKHGAKPAYIKQAVEDSLKRLNIDVIDLYQLHTPDPTVPIADTLGALDDLVKAGKVREIGCSNFSAEQLREAEAAVPAGGARFVSVQNQYSPLQREPEASVLPECERLNVGFLPYSPLANGLLTGKFRQGQPVPEGTRIGGGGQPAERFLTDAEPGHRREADPRTPKRAGTPSWSCRLRGCWHIRRSPR